MDMFRITKSKLREELLILYFTHQKKILFKGVRENI